MIFQDFTTIIFPRHARVSLTEDAKGMETILKTKKNVSKPAEENE